MIAPTFLVENFILGIGQYLEQQSLQNLEKLSELRKIYKDQLPRLRLGGKERLIYPPNNRLIGDSGGVNYFIQKKASNLNYTSHC